MDLYIHICIFIYVYFEYICIYAHIHTRTHISLSHTHTRYHREAAHLTEIVRCRVFFKDFHSILYFVQEIKVKSEALLPVFLENTHVHGSSAYIFGICGMKNRFNPEYNAMDSFGFRDLQMNLEVGFRYANLCILRNTHA